MHDGADSHWGCDWGFGAVYYRWPSQRSKMLPIEVERVSARCGVFWAAGKASDGHQGVDGSPLEPSFSPVLQIETAGKCEEEAAALRVLVVGLARREVT